MDFRERNPTLTVWPTSAVDRLTSIFPYYRFMGLGELSLLPALDDSTNFMLHLGRIEEDEVSSCAHAVEVPFGNKIRQEFERGKISWTEFWGHTGWVIEFSFVLFCDAPIKTRYVPFKKINPVFLQELEELNRLGSPYKIHHDDLVRHCEFEKEYRPKETEYRDEYQEFILKYRGILDESCIIRTEFLEFELESSDKKVA